MERTRDLGSAVAAAFGGVLTAAAFVALFAACSAPVVEVLQRLI